MDTCCWCTPINSVTATLKSYAASTLREDRFAAANEDLCYCLQCVDEYHKAKDEMPSLHEILWKLETSRLIAHFEKSLPTEEEEQIYIMENNEEKKVHCLDSELEKNLRVPLLEILKYPYLLLHKDLSQLFVKAICKMEIINYPCQVLGKHPGVYLLMVHPHEMIRRWAILTARSLGKVDRDDYYDIQEVLTCLLKVIQLNLFENAYVFNPDSAEKGYLILLPDHLYDVNSYKNYWLGICMVLMVLDEQAMDSLLLGPGKQNDFMQCIIMALKKDTDDESNSPFWPALHCFMVILDKLGSKVWGQHIDPTEALQAIINSKSYNKEIENIRQSCKRTRSVPLSDCEDEVVTCSQLVYDYHLEKPQKVTQQKYATCPNYFPDLYEDMRILIDAFQNDFGQDIQLHNSTFLWVIPFVHSLMGLKDLGVAYIVQVINHLCLKTNVSKNSDESYDKVSHFFIWILVIVIQLHLKKNFLSSLVVSADGWVQRVVAWAKVSSAVFMPGIEGRAARNCFRSTATSPSLETESVQSFCMKLIRHILREGLNDAKTPACNEYFKKVNTLLRISLNWELTPHQTEELQIILKNIIWSMWDKLKSSSSAMETPPTWLTPTQKDMCPVNVQEVSILANRYITVQRNMSCSQTLGAQNMGNVGPGLDRPGDFGLVMTKNSDNSDALEEKVGQNDKRVAQGPDLSLRIKRVIENSKKDLMVSETVEAHSVIEQRESQEGPKSNTVAGSAGNTSAPLTGKLVVGSSKDLLGNLAILRNKFRHWVVGQPVSKERSGNNQKDNIPFNIFRQDQREFTAAATATATSTATDIVLSQTTFNNYNQETSLAIGCRQETSNKVIGPVQSQSASEHKLPYKMANEPIHTIIISDSSDEDENQVDKSRKRKRKTSVRHKKQSSAPQQEPLNTSPTNEEHESQLFEFEAEDEIYSEWQDSHMDEGVIKESTDNDHPGTELEINTWGYDANPQWFNPTKEAKEDQVQNSKTKTKPHKLTQKTKISSRSTTSCSTSKGPDAEHSRHIDPSASTVQALAVQSGNAPPQAGPARSTPAVVPPAKVHHFPPPTSLTEELGLSKKVRRAAELSQRTLNSLAELRRHGEIAGRVNVAQKRTPQLTTPLDLINKNKNLFSSQELQFHRQSRRKKKGQYTSLENLEAQTSGEATERAPRLVNMAGMRNENRNTDDLKNSTTGTKLVGQSLQERVIQPTPLSPANKFPLTSQKIANSDTNVQKRTPGSSVVEAKTDNTNLLTSSDSSSGSCDEGESMQANKFPLTRQEIANSDTDVQKRTPGSSVVEAKTDNTNLLTSSDSSSGSCDEGESMQANKFPLTRQEIANSDTDVQKRTPGSSVVEAKTNNTNLLTSSDSSSGSCDEDEDMQANKFPLTRQEIANSDTNVQKRTPGSSVVEAKTDNTNLLTYSDSSSGSCDEDEDMQANKFPLTRQEIANSDTDVQKRTPGSSVVEAKTDNTNLLTSSDSSSGSCDEDEDMQANKFPLTRQEIANSDTNVQKRTPGSSVVEAKTDNTNLLTYSDSSSGSCDEDEDMQANKFPLTRQEIANSDTNVQKRTPGSSVVEAKTNKINLLTYSDSSSGSCDEDEDMQANKFPLTRQTIANSDTDVQKRTPGSSVVEAKTDNTNLLTYSDSSSGSCDEDEDMQANKFPLTRQEIANSDTNVQKRTPGSSVVEAKTNKINLLTYSDSSSGSCDEDEDMQANKFPLTRQTIANSDTDVQKRTPGSSVVEAKTDNTNLLTSSDSSSGSCDEGEAMQANKFPLTRQEIANSDTNVQKRTPGSSVVEAKTDNTNLLTSSDSSSGSCDEDEAMQEEELKLHENIEINDNLFLTQADPVDMELCSQIESDNYATPMEVTVSASPLQGGNKMCTKAGSKRAAESGAHDASHSAGGPQENASTKTFAPPKLSTVKIFSSSSRNANLTKQLESAPMPPTVSKRHSVGSRLQSKNLVPNIILQPQSSNNAPWLQNVQNNYNASKGGLQPDPRAVSRQEMNPCFTQANSLNVQQKNPGMFIKEVLKWTYYMFAVFEERGPPSHLIQSIVTAVPDTFKDYNDYFNIFFPLMMLNTFETVAQDWIENQKSRDKRCFDLILQNFNLSTNEADFMVDILGSNLEKEHYPKLDDFVALIVYEKEAFEADCHQAYHIGCITRIYYKNRERGPVHLSVKTQGNLSCIDKRVQCLSIGSLITMQRIFKALLLLHRSPLAKAIINPTYCDFSNICSKVEIENSSLFMREFNEEQRKVIKTAYGLVTECPWQPKICLIHGPPGSGKSKTILGLLHCIFNERPGKENFVESQIMKNRVLLCAPSNSAIDELMKKIILLFKEQCQDKSKPLGNCGDINLVRLGQERSISKEVWKFSLDAQADHEMNRATIGNNQDIYKQKETLDWQLDALSRLRAIVKNQNIDQLQELDQEIYKLGEERKKLTVQLKKAGDSSLHHLVARKMRLRDLVGTRRSTVAQDFCGRSQDDMKANIILKSHIICCTLSASGSGMLASAFRRQGCDPLSCVIVDEAAQSCELENLIPLIHGCKKLVLVGDPKQLPPTVKSMQAEDNGYGRSLMERLCKQLNRQLQEKLIDHNPVLCLTTQYRMHPEICLFPSSYVYDHALKTDRWTEVNRFSMDWPFQPYLLFDVLDAQEIRESDSFSNPQEVKLVMELMKLIIKRKSGINSRNIGIITPYSAQKRRILNELEKEYGENEKSIAEVDTVDGFQGREKDCIIVSCVRAKNTRGSIGFLKSLQRLNVTLTRAKFSLFILGHLQTLMENRDWNALIQDAQKRGNIIRISCSKSTLNVSTYTGSVKMILKPALVQNLVKARIWQVAPLGEAPAQHPQPSSSGALAPGSSGAPLMLASGNSSSSKPQATSQNRPRDPRLAQRAEGGMRKRPMESDGPKKPKQKKTTEQLL